MSDATVLPPDSWFLIPSHMRGSKQIWKAVNLGGRPATDRALEDYLAFSSEAEALSALEEMDP